MNSKTGRIVLHGRALAGFASALTCILMISGVCGAEGPQTRPAVLNDKPSAELFKEASPESQGVSSAAIKSWADSLEAKGLKPRCYIIQRHGYRIATGEWGGFSINTAHELRGLTRVLGITAAGVAVLQGFSEDDAELGGLLKALCGTGDLFAEERAGDALGVLLEKRLKDSPAHILTHYCLFYNFNGCGWHWGGVPGRDGEFRFSHGAWMHPDLFARLGECLLDGGVIFKKRKLPDWWAAKYLPPVMAYDGRVLAVSKEKDAVVLLFTGTDDTPAVKESVVKLIAGFAEKPLAEDAAALEKLRSTAKRPWKHEDASRPPPFPPEPFAPPTLGDKYKVLELVPDDKVVFRNSESDLIKLNDGRLMLGWSQMKGSTDDHADANLMKCYSSDGGKTWSAPEVLMQKPKGALNVMCVNFLRLRKSGRLAMFYLEKTGPNRSAVLMRVSSDEGATWSEPRHVIAEKERAGYFVLNNARVQQFSNGRIAVPVAMHGPNAAIPYIPYDNGKVGGGIAVWCSDDEGETWWRNDLVICPRDENGRIVRNEEPGMVELKDGSWLLYFRTDAMYQYFARSTDGGKTYSRAMPSTMASPRVPATIERFSDGRLYALWNDPSRDPSIRFRTPYFNGECCPLTLGYSEDEGQTWKILCDIERYGHFCYMFLREIDGNLFAGYCCRGGMKNQRVIKIPLAEVRAMKPLKDNMQIWDNLGSAATGGRNLTASDYHSPRKDGKFESSLAWAMSLLRNMKPAYDADNVKTPEELPAWRGKIRAKLKELLQVRDNLSFEFKLVEKVKRPGYTLMKYEFNPYENLVTRAWMLVPDCATKPGAKVPAVVCMPGNGSSLESLTGEEDHCFVRYPVRNKQAWYYANAGMVAIAMENPASANNSLKGVDYFQTQKYYFELMQRAGMSAWGVATEQVLACVDFLRRDSRVDKERIAVSGMSLGCFSILYAAVLSDDIKAIVYNDFACSWAQREMSVTERPNGSSAYAARDMVGSYRWFDDQPDLMAALAPRPLFLVEDGHGKGVVDKVRRVYGLAGASNNLTFRRYPKFLDDSVRKFDQVDLRTAEGLSDKDFLLYSNVDVSQHSFHPEVCLPWLSRVFGRNPAEYSERLKIEIAAAVAEHEHFATASAAKAKSVRHEGPVDLSGALRTDRYHGFRRYHFDVDGCSAWIVEPDSPRKGNRWVWEMEFPGAFGERTGAMKLVAQGFYDVHIVVGNNYACPASMRHFDAFWKFLVARGFDRRCTPMGYSRGGFYALRFAIEHPERVHSVYGDAPVCDLNSWPGGRGRGKGSPKDWANLLKVWPFASEEDAVKFDRKPINPNMLLRLGMENIPLIFVVGDDDKTVPPCENAELVEKRYKALGGTVHMFHRPGAGHHPHGLDDPTPVLELIKRYSECD